MYLEIASDGVDLKQPEVVTDLYASYWERLGPDTITRVLAENDAGELSDDRQHVMIPVAALRRLAAGRVSEGWDADFDGMLTKARERGWLNEAGDAVQAHLERER
ncbi:hypothetical protein Acsp06_45000 [Actinomycetospora sp. NBRC 106375]|uniref:hypothetical protein n=1 Tax=Actinomycetospora sp. NBRC 106375 TaxID=3032207 RepID=UPI0024A1A537|nr:hypothetical protein [Actinomycetospora sp. NBRC 106375]GLZ48315.1 hypothetical protein Acsp06_45000 [Actinomycetospora sp. NBRC 106375]